jgi:N-acyl-D-amino-acid deacylase
MEDVWVGRYRGYLEAIEISRRAGIPLHIAHFSNAFFIPQPHTEYLEKAVAETSLEIIDKAQKEGVNLTFDVITCSSSIASQAPMINALGRWLAVYGKEILIEKLRKRNFRDEVKKVHEMGRLKFGMVHTKADPYWMACFRVLTCRNKEYEGKTIGELARIRDRNPLDIVLDVLAEDPEAMWVQFMDKRNTVSSISVFIKHSSSMPCTDMGLYSAAPQPKGSLPSPIAYGLYPHYIQTFVKEKAVLSLEEAVMKATSLPANRFNLRDRGILKPGAYADIVLFDLDQICMKGNFLEPVEPPEGIEYVYVNGKTVYRRKTHTKVRPGKVLRVRT